MTAGDVVLAYIPSPPQGVWHLGPLPLRAYALFIIVGIIVAVWWGDRRWQARGGQPGDVLDVALISVPFGLVGGRLYHVVTDWWRYFGDDGKGLAAVFQVWDGGLGIWGAVALGGVGAWVGCRWKGIKLPPFGDALAPAILAAQAIGRIGNYFNQELYGDSTTVPWGLELYQRVNPDTGAAGVSVIDGVSNGHVVGVVHPTFLYELVWNLLIVAALVFVDRRFRIGHGRLFALYVAGYCVGRFWIELMRTDEATHILGLRVNVLVAALVFLGAALYVVIAPKGREEGLSMFRPERAELLASEGEVGYIPPTLDDEYDDSDFEYDDADEEDYVDDEYAVEDSADGVDLDKRVDTIDGTDTDTSVEESVDAVVEEPAEDAADAVVEDEPVEESVDAVVEKPVEDEVDESSVESTADAVVEDEPVEAFVEESVDAVVEEPAEDAADAVVEDEPAETVVEESVSDVVEDAPAEAEETPSASSVTHVVTTGGQDGDAEAEPTIVDVEDEVEELDVPTVEEVRSGTPTIVAHEVGESFTVSSSDSGLDAITVVEENPGWSAGAIEIRPAAPKDEPNDGV
ncbi:prolipoprotein diacylglyceryl transferase [Gordonia sp. MMO-8]|uniref:prolipoprotein diacylglyceryl transferase n=1 Tax=Gordonia sp. PDNC005 TaxID=2811424 RepID=UPI003017B999